MIDPDKQRTAEQTNPRSNLWKRILKTATLAWALLFTSCDKEKDDNNITEPQEPKVEWNEGEEKPIEWVMKIRDILQNNADVRAYLGTRNADHYANQLEGQLNTFGGDPEKLWNILVRLYNELYFSSNAARLGEDDPRPDDVQKLRAMIAKLLNHIPNNGETIFGGDYSAWTTTTFYDQYTETA